METQIATKTETKLTVKGGQSVSDIAVTKDATTQHLLGLSGNHAVMKTALGFLDALLKKTHAKEFPLQPQTDELTTATTVALTKSLHIAEPLLMPLSFASFYGAPSWMPQDSAMYAEYKFYVDTRWFKHATATLATDRLMHVFGLHSTTGDITYWAKDSSASVFVREICGVFLRQHGEEPSAAATIAAQTLEAILKLSINLAREENYGSLERMLPLLELATRGIVPLGIRDDRYVLVAFA